MFSKFSIVLVCKSLITSNAEVRKNAFLFGQNQEI